MRLTEAAGLATYVKNCAAGIDGTLRPQGTELFDLL
jgi:hypothetical protein